jgi:hypothetical protein
MEIPEYEPPLLLLTIAECYYLKKLPLTPADKKK